MRSLQDILEGILGDVDQELDVPGSISKFILKLKKLQFKLFYTMPTIQLHIVRPKDPNKSFYELWGIVQKDSMSKIKNETSDIQRGENCTIVALVTAPDDKQCIIIYNPNVLEVLLISVHRVGREETPVLCAELQTGGYGMYAMDYMMNSRKMLLYKFPAITYDLIKSSIV